MEINWIAIFVSGLIPLFVGAVWYNPKVLGTAWMQASGVTEEQVQSGNMPVIFGLTYLFAVMAAMTLNFMVIHQGHVFSLMVNEPGFGEEGSEVMLYLDAFMADYGNNFRTFKHGAFHGLMVGLTFAFPIIAVIAQFERRSWKYIGIHTGYWALTLTLMGAVICGWQ